MVGNVVDENRLLRHRDDRPDVLYAGHWAGSGSAGEPGEDLDTALARDLAEETCLALERGEAVVVAETIDPVSERLMTSSILHRTLAPSDIALGEGQGVAVFAVEEIATLALPPFLRVVIDTAIAPRLGAAPQAEDVAR